MPSELVQVAIDSVRQARLAYCKFLSSNDIGETGGHQCGIYIGRESWQILFEQQGILGENSRKNVRIKWQNDFSTDSVFTYYGQGTRNEYRITRFGRNFPFLQSDHLGDLFVLVKNDDTEYSGFVFNNEDDFDEFLQAFGMSSTETNRVFQAAMALPADLSIENEFRSYINALPTGFPSSVEVADKAREIYYRVFDHIENIVSNPDRELIKWIDSEYSLFRMIEDVRYRDTVRRGFADINAFIEMASSLMNRRKSRAGKSLEHHLSKVFQSHNLRYSAQPRTEGNRHPDFIFPGENEYHDPNYQRDKLVFLAAKTTCKDRWRQILNESAIIRKKHLFTLQPGISSAQLREMAEENVILVVPEEYRKLYPRSFRDSIFSLNKFILYVREITG